MGYVRRAHGIQGDVIIRSLSDNPARFDPGSEMVTDESPARTLSVSRRRPHADGVLVGFDQVTDRNGAEALRGVTLLIDRSRRRALLPGEFWPDTLEGLVAIDAAGNRLGIVVGVELGSAQDRLVIATDEGRVEVPFVSDLVGEVHPSGGHIVILQPEVFFG